MSILVHRSAHWNSHYQYGKRVYSQTKPSNEVTFYMKSANQKDIHGINKVCFMKNSPFSTRQRKVKTHMIRFLCHFTYFVPYSPCQLLHKTTV